MRWALLALAALACDGVDTMDPRLIPRPPGYNPYTSPADLQLKQSRWGNRTLMSTDPLAPGGVRTAATIIDTDLMTYPVPMLLTFRFQAAIPGFAVDAGAWFASFPVAMNLQVRRGVDILGGMTQDDFAVAVGELPPVSVVLGHKIEVSLAFPAGAPITSFWVEAFAVPLCCFDFVALQGGQGSLAGYGSATFARIAASAVATTIDNGAGPNVRRQFFIQNNSTQDMAVKFSSVANPPSFAAGAESWTFLLPGGANATYESPIGGYTGPISAIWRAADATGEALYTQGFAP